MGDPIKRSTHTPSKTHRGGNKRSADRLHTGSSAKISRPKGLRRTTRLFEDGGGLGTLFFEVFGRRVPAGGFGVERKDNLFRRRFPEGLGPGINFQTSSKGIVGAGDEIRVIERPNHDLTVRDVF